MEDSRDFTRREYLQAAKRWSAAVVSLALGGFIGSPSAQAGSWVNGGGWINGAGGWINRGGSWGNSSAGGWINRR
jgi:hypothetical protein